MHFTLSGKVRKSSDSYPTVTIPFSSLLVHAVLKFAVPHELPILSATFTVTLLNNCNDISLQLLKHFLADRGDKAWPVSYVSTSTTISKCYSKETCC